MENKKIIIKKNTKNGLLIYDASTLPVRCTMKEIYKNFNEKGIVIWASSGMVNVSSKDSKSKPIVLDNKSKVKVVDASKIITKINKDELEKLLVKKETKDMIAWFYKGKEVGRDFLPNGTMGLERDCIAYRNGVEKYDNFKFFKGKVLRLDANKTTIYGKPHGSYAGKRYEKRIKEGIFK